MKELTPIRAQQLAEAKILELSGQIGEELALLSDETREVNIGWIFFYNSRVYLNSNDPVDTLAGNGPILVTKFGEVFLLSSGIPWEESLRNLSYGARF